MTGSPVYIWVRRTTRWDDDVAFEAQLRTSFAASFQPNVETWNRTFNIRYNLFRHRVREIAEWNLQRVRGARRGDYLDIPAGSIVVPVDDDDWFSPDLAEYLQREHQRRAPGGARVLGYRWESFDLKPPPPVFRRIGRFMKYDLWGRKRWQWPIRTNAYALYKDDDSYPYADLENLLMYHDQASDYFEEHSDQFVSTGRSFGVQNRTLASMTTLGPDEPISQQELVRKYREYQSLYSRVSLHGVEWAAPCVEMMAELMRALAPAKL